MGVAKGIRTVYIILVIPNHVTIDKLASALGIRMVSNGLMVLCLGPLVGKFTHRDFNVRCRYSVSFVYFRFRLDPRFYRRLCAVHCFYE